MDMTGSLGLDLSNCTHIVLLEPILDASVEDQIVSRAHRMGQRNKVQVQTLAMKHTVEEKVGKSAMRWLAGLSSSSSLVLFTCSFPEQVVRLRAPSWKERFDSCQGVDDSVDSSRSASAPNLPSTTTMLLTLSKVRHWSSLPPPPPPPPPPPLPRGGTGEKVLDPAGPKPKRKRVRFNDDDADGDGRGERKECQPSPQGRGGGPAPACKDISDVISKFICSLSLTMSKSSLSVRRIMDMESTRALSLFFNVVVTQMRVCV